MFDFDTTGLHNTSVVLLETRLGLNTTFEGSLCRTGLTGEFMSGQDSAITDQRIKALLSASQL